MKLISLCASLLLAGALLFLTSAKQIEDSAKIKTMYAEIQKAPAILTIAVKNNTDRILVVNLYYNSNSSKPLQQKIKAGETHKFQNRSLIQLDKISICCPERYWSIPTELVEWKNIDGCRSECSNFTISANENVDKVIVSVTQDR